MPVTGSLRIFCLCVYCFGICCSCLGVFGVHFRFLGKTSGSFWVLWAALGPLWGALGCHGGRLGLPKAIWSSLTKLDIQFRANGSQVRCLRAINDLTDFIRGSAICLAILPIPAKWRKGRSSPPPFTCAGGQDGVSLEQTLSN